MRVSRVQGGRHVRDVRAVLSHSQRANVRVLGVEYEGKPFSGEHECYQRGIELVFNGRDHSFSSSSLRKRVVEAETEKLLRQK